MPQCGGGIAGVGALSKSDSSLCQRSSGSALWVGIRIAVAVIAIGSANRMAGQDSQKPDAPNAPTSPATAGPTTSQPSQAPSAPMQVPGSGLYNLLEKKSLVFPDIAASTEPLSTGQKFELFVDNSILPLWTGSGRMRGREYAARVLAGVLREAAAFNGECAALTGTERTTRTQRKMSGVCSSRPHLTGKQFV